MKKLTSALLLGIVIAMFFAVPSFAESVKAKDVASKIESLKSGSPIITKPKDLTYSTTNDTVVISGTAKEKDVVNLSVYSKSGSEYWLMGENTIEVGPLGVFTNEVSLKYVGSSPKDVKISDETYVYVRITRGKTVIDDARIIKHTSDEKLQDALTSIKSGSPLRTIGS